jgi:hypothetical protein
MTRASVGTIAGLVGLVGLVACSPPETQRVRGGDPGADIGNRGPVVEMHAGSTIYPDERCAVVAVGCTGPLPLSGREPGPHDPARAAPPVRPDPYVLEHMGQGGSVRRVVYLPPPDLARPDPRDLEPAQPGPGTVRGDDDSPGVPADPEDDPRRAAPPARPDSPDRPDPPALPDR